MQLWAAYRKLTLRQTLILATLLTTFVVYGTTFGIIFNEMRKKNMEQTLVQLRETARAYGNQVAAELNYDIGVSRGMADAFHTFREMEPELRTTLYRQMLLWNLRNHRNYAGSWMSWQLEYYQNDWGKRPGRETTVYFYKGDSIQLNNYRRDTAGVVKRTAYHDMMESKREGIAEPYWADYKGYKVLETTVAVPILRNNVFMGLAGIDINLTSFKPIISSIKPFTRGYAFLMSNSGVYVYHPDTTVIGQSFSEVNHEEDSINRISEKIKAGEPYILYAEHSETQDQVVALFEPVRIGSTDTPWSLGILVHLDEVMAEQNKLLKNTMFVGLVGMLVLLAIILLVTRRIFRTVNDGITFAQLIGTGDLTARMPYKSEHEIGRLTQSMEDMARRFSSFIGDMKRYSADISAFSLELQQKSAGFAQLAGEQKRYADAVNDAVDQITQHIKRSSGGAADTARISKQAFDELTRSTQQAQHAINAIQEIEKTIGVVGDIAQRTHMLALNASIEAARAGEHGKSFSVVALEVRALAEKSRQAAAKIEELSQNGLEVSKQTGSMITALQPNMQQTLELAERISELSIQQEESIERIGKATSQLHALSAENAGFSTFLTQKAKEFEQLSDNLLVLADYFKI